MPPPRNREKQVLIVLGAATLSGLAWLGWKWLGGFGVALLGLLVLFVAVGSSWKATGPSAHRRHRKPMRGIFETKPTSHRRIAPAAGPRSLQWSRRRGSSSWQAQYWRPRGSLCCSPVWVNAVFPSCSGSWAIFRSRFSRRASIGSALSENGSRSKEPWARQAISPPPAPAGWAAAPRRSRRPPRSNRPPRRAR